MRSRLLRSLALAGLCVLIVCITAKAEQQDPTQLQTSLEAESKGNIAERERLLAATMAATPDNPSARWQAGYIRLGTTWVKAEEFAHVAGKRNDLEEYRELRRTSEPTIDSQLKLADFCKRHHLPDQERVHLTAVLELDPEHAAARQRLGYQRVDGQWQTKEEMTAARERSREVAAATQKRRVELAGIRDGLSKGELTHDQAVARLRAMREPAVIPAWELYLSTPLQAGGEAVVAALAEMTDPEASLSLARHATYSRWPQVENAAVEALRGRDEHSYIPSLLSSMQSPWLATVVLLQAPDGRLLQRHSLFADGQEKQQLAVFDQVFFLEGVRQDAQRQALAASNSATNRSEAARIARNDEIDRHNRRVMLLLQRLTGEQEANSPEAWWQWWNDANGTYVQGDKPLAQSYAVNYTTVVGQAREPVYTGGLPSRRPSRSQSSSRSSRLTKECLAGGTPVWTDLGPIAVDRVKMGDLVLARNIATGELTFKPVLRTTVRAPEPLVRIETESDTIRATAGHPFWVSGRGWTLAGDLTPGMVLHGAAQPATIKQLTREEKPARTFNLVVDGLHTYFAGASMVLSHDNSIRKPVANTVPGLAP